MTLDEAIRIRDDRHGFDLWIKNGPDGVDRAVIDGRYSADELEAIAVLMREGQFGNEGGSSDG